MNIGIIGAENSHCATVAKLVNVNKAVRGVQVTHVWGETRTFAVKAAEAGQIPTIVRRPEDMIGQVDGVMIDHRDGKFHLAVARKFVAARMPVFVDKPMSTSLAEAKRFLAHRRQKRVPICTMSSIPYHKDMPDLVRRLRKIGRLRLLRLSGPGDYKSKWGGIWFYGIHQVELMIHLLGTAAQRASMTTNGTDSTAIVNYADGLTVQMSFLVNAPYQFRVQAVGHEGSLDWPMSHDPATVVATTRIFTTMFRTKKEPFGNERMLAPLAVLEAMAKSLKTGRAVKVAAVK